jgi:hypothetical protein
MFCSHMVLQFPTPYVHHQGSDSAVCSNFFLSLRYSLPVRSSLNWSFTIYKSSKHNSKNNNNNNTTTTSSLKGTQYFLLWRESWGPDMMMLSCSLQLAAMGWLCRHFSSHCVFILWSTVLWKVKDDKFLTLYWTHFFHNVHNWYALSNCFASSTLCHYFPASLSGSYLIMMEFRKIQSESLDNMFLLELWMVR